MKKIITKLGLIFTGLLAVLSVGIYFLTDNVAQKQLPVENNQSTNIASSSDQNFTNTNFTTSIEVVYSDNVWVDDSRINGINEATGNDFYVSLYLNVVSGVQVFTFQWQLDSTVDVESIEFIQPDNSAVILADKMAAGDMSAMMGYMSTKALDNGSTDFKKNQGTLDFKQNGNLISLTFAAGTNPQVTAGKWLLGKIKVTTKSSTSSFSMTSKNVTLKGSDTGMSEYKNAFGDPAWNISFGAGSLSDVTLTKATIGSVTVTGTETGTAPNKSGSISIELDPNSFNLNQNYTITLSVDGGNGTASALTTSSSGMSTSGTSFTVNFSARDTDLTGQFTATAQDGTTTANYTLSAKIKKYSDAALTSLTVAQATSGISYGPVFKNPNSNSANVSLATDNIKISSTTTQVTLTPTVNTSHGMTVKIGDDLVTSGTSKTVTATPGSTVTITVIPEDGGTSKSYTYTFEKVADIETPSSIGIGPTAGSTALGTQSEAQLNSSGYTFEIPYSTSGTPNDTVYITPVAKPNSTAVSDLPSVTFSGTGESSQTVTITITDTTTGKKTEKTLTIKRKAADNTTTATSFALSYSKSGNQTIYGSLSGYQYNCSTKLPYDVNAVNLTTNLTKTTSKWSYTVSSGGTGSSSASNLASGTQQVVTLESPGTNTAKIFEIIVTVTAESGSTLDYKIRIEREGPDQDCTLKTFTSSNKPSGSTINFAPANPDITISDVPTTTTSISVTPTANKTTSHVTIYKSDQTTVLAGGTSSMCTGSLALTGLSETNSITYYVVVESEAYLKDPVTYASAKQTYTITVSAKPAPPKSDDSSATSLTHTPNGGSATQLLTSSSAGPTFNVTYAATVTSTLINVTPKVAASTVLIEAANTVDGTTQTNQNGNKFLNVTNLPTGLTIVTVTITPENGDAAKKTIYTINITKSASDKDGILSITINDKIAPVPAKGGSTNMELNQNPIPTFLKVNVTPEDSKSTVTVAGATKNPDGTWTIQGVQPGGPSHVVVSVQPEDTTKPAATYTVNVWIDDDTSLQDLKVEESNVLQPFIQSPTSSTIVTFEPDKYSYFVKIPYTMNSVDLTYTLNASDPANVTVEINGSAFNPTAGLNYATKKIDTTATSTTVTIKVSQNSPIVTNKTATMKTYTVKISKDNAKSDKDIKTLTPDPTYPLSPTFSSSTTEYIVVLPRGTQNYKVTGLTYDCAVDSTNSTPKVTTTGAFPSTTNFSEVTFGLTNGVNLETITVEAEDGTTKVYKFYIICAENKGGLTNIELLNSTNGDLLDVNNNKFTFNSSQTNPPKFEINATSSAVQIKMTKEGSYATVKISPNIKYSTAGSMNETHTITALAAGDNTYKIQAVSELQAILDADATIPANLKAQVTANKSDEYTVVINQKNLDNDATLNVFEVRIGGSATDMLAGKFTPQEHGKTYQIGNIGNQDNFSLTIIADPTKSTTGVGLATGGDNASGTMGNKSQTVSLLGAGKSNFTITIETTAQDGVTKERYVVELYRGDIDLDSDTTIAKIYIRDDKGRENYITFDATDHNPYKVTIPADVKTYTIFAEVLQGSKAKPQIICSGGNSSCSSTPYIGNHLEGPIDSTYWSGSQPYITYNVIGLANNGTTGQPYIVEVSFEKPSADANLDKLTANSQDLDVTLVPAIYTLNVPFETNKIPLYALAHDATATIQINFQDGSSPLTVTKELNIAEYALNEGLNTITVTVTPQSGAADAKTYQIIVNRAYQSPKLLDLGVLGYPLLEDDPTKENEVEFDPEVKAYRVNVPFIKEQAEIFATPANQTDLVTGVGVKNLLVGENICIVRVTNTAGDYTEYKIIIRRYSADEANADAANAKILEISQFELDFNPLETLYEYHVTNDITDLTPIFTPANPSGKSNVEYYGKKLHSGENALIVIITAPDGITTKTYVVKVNRDKMAYEVNNAKYPDYTVEATEVANEYKVNIGSAKSVDVDFTRFISPATSNLKVEVISNVSQNPDEVIVTIFDGEETEIVKLLVQSTGNPKDGVQWKDLWPLLLLLIIVIILLILILICVNRDKFGKLAKKANNKQDKKNKKDAEKNSGK